MIPTTPDISKVKNKQNNDFVVEKLYWLSLHLHNRKTEPQQVVCLVQIILLREVEDGVLTVLGT